MEGNDVGQELVGNQTSLFFRLQCNSSWADGSGSVGGGQRSMLTVEKESGRLLIKWNGKNSERLDIQFKNYVIVCVNDLR